MSELNDGWVATADRRPTWNDASKEHGLVELYNKEGRRSFELFELAAPVLWDYWRTPTPLPKQESEVEKLREEYLRHNGLWQGTEWFDLHIRIVRAVVKEDSKCSR